MATKNNPGAYDCYAHAEPDEPIFVLLGRDPAACLLVALWAAIREEMGTAAPEKIAEARRCASEMYNWAIRHGRRPEELAEVMRQMLQKGFSMSFEQTEYAIDALLQDRRL
jgi:hypothetical protein